VYTAGGTYPVEELFGIVGSLSRQTGLSPAQLQFAYGRHLFGRLISLYPVFAEGKATPLDFIASVDDVIHVEVRKLYPDAELPRFIVESRDPDRLVMLYQSTRKMEEFGHGLIMGCSDFYKKPLKVEMSPVANHDIYTVRMTISYDTAPQAKPAPSSGGGLWGTIKRLFGIK
jgi:hypothetical protein